MSTLTLALFLSFRNFLIQLFGELVVTDGLIGFASSYFTDAYKIDLPLYWANRDRNIYYAAFLLIALFGINNFVFLAVNTCFTAASNSTVVDGEVMFEVEDWVVQICPPPPKGIEDMSRVGVKFVTEFLNATAVGEFVAGFLNVTNATNATAVGEFVAGFLDVTNATNATVVEDVFAGFLNITNATNATVVGS